MRLYRRIFQRLLLTLLILFTTFQPAISAEEPTPPDCSIDDVGQVLPGDIIVNFNKTELRSDQPAHQEAGYFYPSENIEPGQYDILVEAWDHHSWVVAQFPPSQYDVRLHQDFEQMFLKLYENDTQRYETKETVDIDSYEDIAITDVETDFQIDYLINRLRIEHFVDHTTSNQEPNSFVALCARFRPLGEKNVVKGKVIVDTDRSAYLDSNGVCVDDETNGTEPGTGSQVQLSDNSTGEIETDGSFSVSGNNPGSSVVTVNIADLTNWACSCPTSCSYPVELDENTPQEVTFYVTQQRDSWFQISGGDVHAENAGSGSDLAISNPLPQSCIGSCSPFTTTRDNSDTANTSGVITYGNGNVDLSDAFGDQSNVNLDEDTNGRIAQTFLFDDGTIRFKQGYNYFYRLQEFPLNPISDFTENSGDLPKPVDPTPETAFYHQGDITINQDWNVAAGESVTIFIDGNLTINANLTVDPGGHLIFIVSGDVTVSADVGNDNPADTTGNIEAIIVADGKISVQGYADDTEDKKFVGEGIFVGWNGIEFDRDFQTAQNNLYPSVIFSYRPDMIYGLNRSELRSIFSWKQDLP